MANVLPRYGNKTFKERYPELEKFYAKDNTLPYEDAIVSDYTPRNWICEKVMNSRLHFTKFMIKVLDVLIAKIKKH